MPCPRTQHLNNVPRLRGEKHDISLKILHQAGYETARQAETSAERHALAIAPCHNQNQTSLSHLCTIIFEIKGHSELSFDFIHKTGQGGFNP